MNKLTPIKHEKEGQVNAVQLFLKVWMKFIGYWNTVRPQGDTDKEVIELV